MTSVVRALPVSSTARALVRHAASSSTASAHSNATLASSACIVRVASDYGEFWLACGLTTLMVMAVFGLVIYHERVRRMMQATIDRQARAAARVPPPIGTVRPPFIVRVVPPRPHGHEADDEESGCDDEENAYKGVPLDHEIAHPSPPSATLRRGSISALFDSQDDNAHLLPFPSPESV